MYTSETDLQSNVNGLIEQRIKKQVESRITPKLNKFNVKQFESKKYYLKFDIDNFATEIINELSSIIIGSVKDKEKAITKIKGIYFRGGTTMFAKENIEKYVDNRLSDFKF